MNRGSDYCPVNMTSFTPAIWEKSTDGTPVVSLLLVGAGLLLGSFLGFGFAVSLPWVTKDARKPQANCHPEPAPFPKRVPDPDSPLYQDRHHLPTSPLRRTFSENDILSLTEVEVNFRLAGGNNGIDTIGWDPDVWMEGLCRNSPHDAYHRFYPISPTTDRGMISPSRSNIWAEERGIESFGQEQEQAERVTA